jgi:hypothetical protein
MRYFRLLFLSLLLTATAQSEERSHHSEGLFEHGRNHLSLFLGGTDIDSEGQGFTSGLDYEYRVNELLGLGAVVEYAGGEIDAWSFLAVADIHIYEGLVAQVGPGFETTSEEDVFITRFGMLYEFEYESGFTISPQLHYDFHDGAEDGIVFGIALGFAF